MANIYDNRRIWKTVFLAVSLVLVAFFLHISNNLVDDLADQERERMEIWANATKALTSAQSSDIDFYLSIIKNNNNIPVLLVDDNDNILMSRNFKMPEPVDSLTPDLLSDANRAFLAKRLKDLKKQTTISQSKSTAPQRNTSTMRTPRYSQACPTCRASRLP